MRCIIFFTLLLISTAQAQTTWTVARARDSIIAIQKKQAIKDANDDKRNMSIDSLRQSRDLLFWENKRLKERLDSAAAYFNTDQFDWDSITKTYSIKSKPDTFIIIRSQKAAQQLITAKKARKAITNNLTKSTLPNLEMSYTIGTSNLSQKDQDIADLKWQIDYFEKLLDDDKKVIDKLQKIINKQQGQIENLTKQTEY